MNNFYNQQPLAYGDTPYWAATQWANVHRPAAKSVYTHAGTDMTPAAWVSGIDNSYLADRTRYFSLPLWNEAGTVPSNDNHGNFNTGQNHYDFPDAATTVVSNLGGMVLPADFVSIAAVNLIYLCSTNTGNLQMQWQVFAYSAGDSSLTTLLNTTETIAAPGTANQMTGKTLTLTTPPTSGQRLQVRLIRLGNDAADTCTGTVAIYEADFSYTADM